MGADHRSIDETAHVCICEELAPVCKRHPVNPNRTCVVTLATNVVIHKHILQCIHWTSLKPFLLYFTTPTEKFAVLHWNVPELPIVLHHNAKVVPLFVADLGPFLRADNQQVNEIVKTLTNCLDTKKTRCGYWDWMVDHRIDMRRLCWILNCPLPGRSVLTCKYTDSVYFLSYLIFTAYPHLSLQAPFHSILPQGFLMRIRGMVSFLKKASSPWPKRTFFTAVTEYAWPFTSPFAILASSSWGCAWLK